MRHLGTGFRCRSMTDFAKRQQDPTSRKAHHFFHKQGIEPGSFSSPVCNCVVELLSMNRPYSVGHSAPEIVCLWCRKHPPHKSSDKTALSICEGGIDELTASFAVGVGKSPLTARSFNRDIYVRPDFSSCIVRLLFDLRVMRPRHGESEASLFA